MALTSGLTSLLGIDSTAGNSQLQQALQAIQGVQTPTAGQLTLPQLQQYVQQGIITPAQYQAVLEDPQTYSKIIQATQDNSGTTAQKAALQQLGGIVNAGGSTDINKANLLNNINSTNQAMQASRQGIMENAQERGVSGGGLDFISQLQNEQGNAANANSNAVNSAASNAQLALNAIAQQGQIGGQLQSQSNQSSQAQAAAAQQIAQYNSQLQNTAAQYNTTNANAAQAANLAEKQSVADQNTGNANMRTSYNASVPQTVYQDQVQKANDMANAYTGQGNLAQQQAANNAALTGGLIGTAAKLYGGYSAGTTGGSGSTTGMDTSSANYQTNAAANNPNKQDTSSFYAHGGTVQCYAQGGEVHDHTLCMKAGGHVPGKAPVPGDSYQNDTVDAKLSPGEVVLPRSVTQSPNAPQKAAQFMGKQPGSMTPTVGSFAEALKAMEEQGLELRLHAKGA